MVLMLLLPLLAARFSEVYSTGWSPRFSSENAINMLRVGAGRRQSGRLSHIALRLAERGMAMGRVLQ